MEDQNKVDWKKLDLMDDDELKEINDKIKIIEQEGKNNILKYFDRIHDKLFSLNNIFIVAFFALFKLNDNTPLFTVFIPLVNLCLLLFIEYRMMEKSRIESEISSKFEEFTKIHKNQIDRTNLYSLLTIFSTLIVFIAFIYYLIK